MNSIIFETGYTGHRSEYVAHLMRFINAQQDLEGKFVFVLNEKMKPLLGDLSASPAYIIEFLKFEKKQKNSITRSFWEWDLITEIIKKQKNIAQIIFMEIDPYLVLLCTNRFKKFNLLVKGILFQPYVHFKDVKEQNLTIIQNLFKNYLFQKFSSLLNRNIKKLFVLNDKRTINIMNKRIKNIFYNLPDPIADNVDKADEITIKDVVEKFNINSNKKNLLVFGSIDDRKNLITVIDAVRLLPSGFKDNVHLVVAGKFSASVKDQYIKHIETYKNEISVAYNNAFVNGQQREPLFEKCDVVLMPYINFYSASSVLGHAIHHNKNVIVSKKGLIGRIVLENNLGIAVDPLNAVEIKDAICELLSNSGKYSYDSKMLIEEYSPHNFSKTILLN